MSLRRPRPLLWTLLLAAGALAVWLVAITPGSGDYILHGAPGADNAGPPIEALAHGRFAELPRVQTVMGLTSVLWRVPFVVVANGFGAGGRLGYSVGAVACLLPLVGLVGWLATREPSWHQLAAAALAALVMILGPSTASALRDGHPEEALTIALAIAAVLAAQADRRLTAAVLLGLAIGSKEWALLAAVPVLVALPAGRRRAALIACGVAALASAPLVLLDPVAFHRADTTIGPIHVVDAMSVWWPISAVMGHHLPFHMQRPEAAGGGLAAAAAIVCLVGLALRGRPACGREVRAWIDPMALLALIGLLRCITDPEDGSYYLVAAVIPLVVWEVGTRRRLPVAAVLLWGVQGLCFTGPSPFGQGFPELSGAPAVPTFVAATLLLAGYLTVRTFVRSAPALRPVASRSPAPAGGLMGLAD